MQEVGGKVPPTCRSWVLCVGKTRRFFGQKKAPKSHETHRRSWWNSSFRTCLLWGFDVVENSFKNCHNSVWIMMSCWNPNRWFFLVSKTHWITPCNNIPKKSLSCQSCAKLILSGPSLSQERSTERHAVAFLPQHDKSGKVLFPPSRKLTYPTLKKKETNLQKCLRGPMWSFLQGSFLQVAPPPRANLPHLRCRYSLPQALQRWRKKGAVGQTNHWVARFSTHLSALSDNIILDSTCAGFYRWAYQD